MTKKQLRLAVLAGAVVAALVVGLAGGWFGKQATTDLGDDAAPLAPASRVLRYERVARRVWGDICGGRVSVTIAPLKKGAIGQASWTRTVPISHCVIVVSDEKRWSNRMLCGIIVHEYGHLARDSLKHSANPRSVMFNSLGRGNIPASCRGG